MAISLFAACLAAQVYLVFLKSFNWDEFLHFSQVYQARSGTLSQPFQVLHARILWWVPEVTEDLIVQMKAARLFIWGAHLVTLAMIYCLARRFTNAGNAFFASFAYLTAGFVFEHSFAIRADPLVTAVLMVALVLTAKGPLSLAKATAAGLLIGLAGMMTLKALFYAPCFCGLLWLRYAEAENKRLAVVTAVVTILATLCSFAAIYLYHTARLAAPPAGSQTPLVMRHLPWFSAILPRANYIGAQILLAPIFFLALIFIPKVLRETVSARPAKVALLGLLLPLVVLLFYRNTFPYFFVFILAPAAVALGPVFGLMRARIGNSLLAVLLSVSPLTATLLEPTDVIRRQQALIDYVHRDYPVRTGYLDYAGMIADYPRVLRHLTSGVGIASYHGRGQPTVAREIDRGNVPFIINNHIALEAVLKGRALPNTFLPDDAAAIGGNYVRQWGELWREGVSVPSGDRPVAFRLRRPGLFVAAGSPFSVNGVRVVHGQRLWLQEGENTITGQRAGNATLWRGSRLPSPPPEETAGPLFTEF